jgi:hypothetical protein
MGKDRHGTPPRLFDLPSLQKTCGQRWGWTADKTLAIAQQLYDGEGGKLISYPGPRPAISPRTRSPTCRFRSSSKSAASQRDLLRASEWQGR